ncbi:hypothetical protein PB01_20270 [Psychrobacillus glaciei]|uniref:Uncharacterized protein n=1 Tax=Psychrobacillus glaciei TaxID=2283160 RepID=A0A5J6SSA6_9BACI|nr:hypothetical protein [Psychrobacillus glaciei]QFG00939.1 hypothetical protein PB01_20270 [Psychrobacillus glaciei]
MKRVISIQTPIRNMLKWSPPFLEHTITFCKPYKSKDKKKPIPTQLLVITEKGDKIEDILYFW